MKKVMVGFALAMVLSLSAVAAFAQQSVAGNWVLSVQSMSLQMVLEQDGENISGTIDTPHGLIQVSGELTKGELSLWGAATEGHPVEVRANATLNADGSLSGTLSAAGMDLSFTAARDGK